MVKDFNTHRCMLDFDTLFLGCVFRRNFVYSGTFLLFPAELRYLMPPENGKVTKSSAKEMSSLPALQLIYIHIYYVCMP